MSEEVNRPEKEYSASSIQVLEGLEAVRKRPAMYIGDIGEKGLHHLVYEVVDNSIDEALAGYCTDIEVTINEDGSVSVRDNGRGIPTDYHEKEGRSALEVVLTVLHAGGKFDKGSYKVSGGLHGVGVSCVNALSTLLIAEVHRDGKIYRETFSKGVPTSKLEIVGECSDRGTTITFKPDGEIFTHTTEYKYEILSNRLRELAFLNKGIQLTITDKRVKDEQGGYLSETFHSKDGLKEFVQYLDATRGEPIIESIIYLDTEKNGVPVRENLLGMSPDVIVQKGVSMDFVPEDRLGMGLVASMDMTDNVMLRSYKSGKGIFVDRKSPRELAERMIDELEIATPGVDTPVGRLSGGNVQKVLLGREIKAGPNVIITAYPVRGLDINSSYRIYDFLNEQKKKGVAVIFIGEDLDVLVELCDRIMVLNSGRITGIVDGPSATKEELGILMTKRVKEEGETHA